MFCIFLSGSADYNPQNEIHYSVTHDFITPFYYIADSFCLTLDISADMLIEDDEQFKVTIEILDGRLNDTIVGPDEIIVTIIDIDGEVIYYDV